MDYQQSDLESYLTSLRRKEQRLNKTRVLIGVSLAVLVCIGIALYFNTATAESTSSAAHERGRGRGRGRRARGGRGGACYSQAGWRVRWARDVKHGTEKLRKEWLCPVNGGKAKGETCSKRCIEGEKRKSHMIINKCGCKCYNMLTNGYDEQLC